MVRQGERTTKNPGKKEKNPGEGKRGLLNTPLLEGGNCKDVWDTLEKRFFKGKLAGAVGGIIGRREGGTGTAPCEKKNTPWNHKSRRHQEREETKTAFKLGTC